MLLLSLSALLLEHFFSKPTDVVAASISVLLLLVPLRGLLTAMGNWYWILVGVALFLLSCALTSLLLLTEVDSGNSNRNRAARILKTLSVEVGSAKKQYLLVLLVTALFYLEPASSSFAAVVLYSAAIVVIDPKRMLLRIQRAARPREEEVGEILGVRGKNTFLVRLHPRGRRPSIKASDVLEFSYGIDEPPRSRQGIVLERYYLDQAQWINVLCIDPSEEQGVGNRSETLSRRTDAVYRGDGTIAKDLLKDLVGVVIDGSTIQELRFLHAGRARVEEGTLVEVEVKGKRILYQVVNAVVDFQALESKNQADLVIGSAVQLGVWDPEHNRFDRFGWVPDAYSKLSLSRDFRPPPPSSDEVVLGKIPGSGYEVILNKRDAISHHTAILGVTGAGKSVFARRLVSELLADDDVRIVIVDFTREWAEKVPSERTGRIIPESLEPDLFDAINRLSRQKAEFPNKRNNHEIRNCRRILDEGFKTAISDFLDGDKPLGIFELPDVSNAEGVLEFTQTFFWALFNMAKDGKLGGKRVCIVLEEAHTVIPEWNFLGIADKSSQALVNNLSQIALQGRKYGIGFVVIAQRTANVSKTVLTQCNTVIAFQCFDNTSVGFLENYLPKSVAAAVPTLRFRHAVAVGKAIGGSVPLMFEVPFIND